MNCELPGLTGSALCTARPTFSLRATASIVVLWCLLVFLQSWPSMIVVSVMLLTWLFGCHRTRQAVYWVVPAMYTPWWIVISLGGSWADGNVSAFPTNLASIPGGAVLRWPIGAQDSTATEIGAAVIASTLFLLAVTLIRFYPQTRLTVLLTALTIGFSSALFSAEF